MVDNTKDHVATVGSVDTLVDTSVAYSLADMAIEKERWLRSFRVEGAHFLIQIH